MCMGAVGAKVQRPLAELGTRNNAILNLLYSMFLSLRDVAGL